MFLLFMTATVLFVAIYRRMASAASARRLQIWRAWKARRVSPPGRELLVRAPIGRTPLDYVIWAVVMDIAWAFVYAVGPWQASRHLMARDEHVVLRAATLACFCVIVLQMLVYGIGGLMNLAKTDITPSETVLIWAAKSMVPELSGRFPGSGQSWLQPCRRRPRFCHWLDSVSATIWAASHLRLLSTQHARLC